MIDRYGVDSALKSPEIKEKARQTCFEKYGNIFPAKTDIIKQKVITICQKKYGCNNVFQDEQIKEKIKQTYLDKYGVVHPLKDVKRAKENTKKGLETRIKQGKVKIYENKIIAEWAKEIGYSKSHFNVLVTKYGFEQAVKMEPHISSLEKLMMDWLDSINIKYTSQYKVDNKIADIYIPSNNLIIETDGLYWHSDAIISNKNYHIEKRQLYISKGFTPLFFRENEIVNLDKFKIVQSIIKNKLNLSERIFARKCIIKPVDKSSAKTFFTANHLMGNGSGQTYGLFFSDKLVGAIQIRGHKEGYEIARFCNLLNTNIIGGFSKLLTYIQNNVLNSKSLITFIDLRYGIGSYLTSFNFKYSTTYPSFKWTNGKEIFNRMAFPSMSGYQNGLSRLWDCGQAKYVLNGV